MKKCRSLTGGVVSLQPVTPFLLDRKRAAGMLSISLRSTDYLIAKGRLRARRIGGRVLVPIEELRRFASSDRTDSIVPVATAA
ncbi:helix-turn-helix domain-containing protein [Granulicella arctica]|uniref:helix-turn-helix domain-containing protein n=1 Tax=Granulicella arctica TaxID=940613 RepID=UPI0037C07433